MENYNAHDSLANAGVRKEKGLDTINPNAAGIDMHSKTHMACAPSDKNGKHPVKTFGTYTENLIDMAKWLKENGATTVAMEATGVFWWPLVETLRAEGLEVLLVNAREVRSVKGRPKTDKLDCEWLRRLHACGMLRGSFIPDADTAEMKNLWRHRQNLEEESARAVMRMQKSLQLMNVRLDIAVTDITGQTGMRIIESILSGERDPKKLARLRDRRVKKSEAEIAAALNGNFKADQLFILKDNLTSYKTCQKRIGDTDAELKRKMDAMPKKASAASAPPAAKKSRHYDGPLTRERIFELLGVDLTQVDGVGILTAASFLVNAGRDMSHWLTGRHFASWLGLCPNARQSGGKSGKGRTKKTCSALAHSLRMAAECVGKTDTPLGAFYRRLKGRLGSPKAITATARKLALIFYEAVKSGKMGAAPSSEMYEQLQKGRMLKSLLKKAARLGFKVVPMEDAAVA